MMEAVIGLIGALVGVFVSARFSSKEQRVKEIADLADFLQEISTSLLGMQEKLSVDEIPTYYGNKYNTALEKYKKTIADSKISKQRKKELEEILPELESRLKDAKFVDEILRGAAIQYPVELKRKILAELKRTAAQLDGIIAVLRVTH